MAWRVELADLLMNLRRARRIMHVAKMVFTLDVVLVLFDELIFVGEFEYDGEEAEKLDDYFVVALSAESFDFFDVILQNRRLCTLVVAVELGDVIDLDRVGDSLSESGWSADALRLGR